MPSAELEGLAVRVAATWSGEDAPRFVRLGRFQLERELGRGTYGVVFAAFDCEIEREVALKIFDADALAEATHEARALARVSHPNVIALFDLGCAEGFVYLVIDYVEGWTMAERMHMNIGWRRLVGLFIQAGRGLAAVHDAELEHGDVKPHNILVGYDGQVKLADFGLARSVHEAGSAEPEERGGTLAYAAPEWLFEGVRDARSDQFSFCVTMWEALFGVRPFAREGVAYEAMLIEAVAPAKRRSPLGLPAALEGALQRGLAARPKARFASMHELVEALMCAMIDSERRRARWHRRVGVAAAIAVAVVTTATCHTPKGPSEQERNEESRGVW